MTDTEKTLRALLREPLPAAAIKPHPTKTWSSSINGAYIVERLNDIFGEDGWDEEYTIIENRPEQKMVVVLCELSANFPDRAKITRRAFGGNDNSDRGDAYKGACTDALGKAASKLGIAGEVYKGMLDVEQAPRQAGKKAERQKFEAVGGRVTELRNVSPSQVFIQVNSNGLWIRTDNVADADRLRKSLGCKVEVTAKWAKGKNKKGEAEDIMIVTAVHGVYNAVPRTDYIAREEDDPHLSPDMVAK